jgi:hypothetical protein
MVRRCYPKLPPRELRLLVRRWRAISPDLRISDSTSTAVCEVQVGSRNRPSDRPLHFGRKHPKRTQIQVVDRGEFQLFIVPDPELEPFPFDRQIQRPGELILKRKDLGHAQYSFSPGLVKIEALGHVTTSKICDNHSVLNRS